MFTQDDPKFAEIAEKIQKLMALAESSNENEAAVAAAKAQELLAKYNLDLAQVRGFTAKTDEEIIEVATNDDKYKKRQAWIVELADVIAKHNFCTALFSSHGHTYFIGHTRDVNVAVFLFNNLRVRLFKLATDRTYEYSLTLKKNRSYIRDTYEELSGNVHPRVWRNSWLMGAVAGINKKLNESRKDFAEAPNAMTMIVVREQEVSTWVKQKYPKLSSVSLGGGQNVGATVSGFRTGYEMAMQTGITSSSTTKALR